jgi:hypothetical protein
MVCLWLYCISITKKSDRSITVIYHAMSLTTVSVSPRRVICLSQWFIMLCLWLLYQYHQGEWYVNHSDLSRYVSDYSIRITKSDRSITVIYHAVSDYCISITGKSDRSITVIYHAMSLTTVSVSPRRVICLLVIYHAMSLTTVSVSLRRVKGLSRWFIVLCL